MRAETIDDAGWREAMTHPRPRIRVMMDDCDIPKKQEWDTATGSAKCR